MRFPIKAALLAAAVVVLAAGAGATAGANDRTAGAKAGRLVSFGSCGELLAYAKTQAGRFVGPYGLAGRNVLYAAVPSAAASGASESTAKDAAAAPVQGV